MSTFGQAVGVSLGLLFIMMTGVSAQVDCTDREDGAYDNGCSSYTNCTGGVGEVVICPPEWAFDHATKQCEPWETCGSPCGSSANNCTGHPDNLYAVQPECKYFYTCQNELFIGAFPCNNPPDIGDLVFDYDMQVCNWDWAVLPPCGSMVPPQLKSKKV